MVIAPNTNVKIDIKWDDRAESDLTLPAMSTVLLLPGRLTAGGYSRGGSLSRADKGKSDRSRIGGTWKKITTRISALRPTLPQEPAAWGPHRLIKHVPASELGSYLNDGEDSGTYTCLKTQVTCHIRFHYYYYVAAYNNDPGSINGQAFNGLETHRHNFNGRDLWKGTYHYATASSFFPGDLQAEGHWGAFILKSPWSILGIGQWKVSLSA